MTGRWWQKHTNGGACAWTTVHSHPDGLAGNADLRNGDQASLREARPLSSAVMKELPTLCRPAMSSSSLQVPQISRLPGSVAATEVTVVPHPTLDTGVAHKCLAQTPDFGVVGFYPAGQNVDMMYGKPEERPTADNRIRALSLPAADPMFGPSGPLVSLWR